MAKEVATRKSGGKSLAVLSEELARLAQDESANVPQSAGQFISVKGKRFTFQDEVIPSPLSVIVLDHALTNAFYSNGYEEGNPQPPDCWAVGKTEKELVPLATLAGRVHDTCAGCPNNEWGSADKGKGKACKNGRILALIAIDAKAKKLTAKAVEEATVAYMRLSPTALRPFNGYLKRITGTLSKPLFTIVTALSFDESSDYPVVLPSFVDELTDEAAIRALMAKREAIQDELLAGYPLKATSDEDDSPAPKKGRSQAAKPAKGGKRKGKY